MGQKVHPIGMRLGVIKQQLAVWYADKNQFTRNLRADIELRRLLAKKLENASISEIYIERMAKNAQIIIRTASPGIVIGKKGTGIAALSELASRCLRMEVYVNIQEIKAPELESRLVAENIARQLERRVAYRRAMKRAVTGSMNAGAQGIKVEVSGRLSGADIARSEGYKEGCIPLHTLRADVDYAVAEALTTYGITGVKVWIFRGEVFDRSKKFQERNEVSQPRRNKAKSKRR